MCRAIYGIGLIAIHMREGYEHWAWRMADWTRAGAGGEVVMGSNPA